MGVAARSMAWQQRRRNRPGPLGVDGAISAGSGEQPTGGPQVELFIAGSWVDVTALGLVRYAQKINITSGMPNENQGVNPGTATFRLANLDGRFTPANPLGPYYGQIDRNTPCRISVQSGNVKSYRFWGEIAAWPVDWDPSGNDAWVDVQAAGVLRRLGTGAKPIRSAPYQYWTGTSPSPLAVAYWPMEDVAGASQFASGLSGGRPMFFTGSPSLAASTVIVPSAGLPTFVSGASAQASIPTYTPGSPINLSGVTCYVAIPSGGETSQVLIQFSTNGIYPTWELYYTSGSGGQLGFRARDASGNIALDTSPGAAAMSVNGVPVIVSMDTWWDGTFAGLDWQLQTVSYPGSSVFYQVETAAASTVGRLTTAKIAPTAALTGTAIGHLGVATQAGYVPTLAYQGQPAENAALRFQRLCGLVGVSSHIVYNPASGDIGPQMGPQHPGKILDLLQECVDADGGLMFELLDRVGLGYRTRDSLENQSPVLTLDYSLAQLAVVPKPTVDDTYTRNDITATRLNGSSAVTSQTTGPLNTAAAPLGVGDYQTSATVNVLKDQQIGDQAGWRLHLGTIAEPRYPVLGVQLSQPEILASPLLRQQILAVSPGDRVAVANPPAWLPPDALSLLAIGWTETLDQFQHLIKWNTRPESPFRVGVLDDPVFGRADTDGSTLAQGMGAPTGNPFFTGGSLAGWTAFQGSIAASQAYPGGPFSWSCVLTSSGGAGSDVNGFLMQFAINPNGTAQTSCWVNFPTGGQVDVGVDWQDATNTYISTSVTTVTVPAGVWTAIGSGPLTAPGSAATAYPRVGPHTPANGLLLAVQGLLSWIGVTSVATTNPNSPIWTTSSSDFPFDVTAGGERMTVTGVTGASSPQAFTVVRAANGVLKAQTAGTAVQLYQPATLSM